MPSALRRAHRVQAEQVWRRRARPWAAEEGWHATTRYPSRPSDQERGETPPMQVPYREDSPQVGKAVSRWAERRGSRWAWGKPPPAPSRGSTRAAGQGRISAAGLRPPQAGLAVPTHGENRAKPGSRAHWRPPLHSISEWGQTSAATGEPDSKPLKQAEVPALERRFPGSGHTPPGEPGIPNARVPAERLP